MVKVPTEPRDCYSPEEVFVAIAAIKERDRTILLIAAIRYASGTRYEADDFLSEAIARTLEGDRKWKKDIPLYWHLCGVMQSMRSFEFKHKKIVKDHHLKLFGAINRFGETLLKLGGIGSSQNDNPDPHEIVGRKQELIRVLKSGKFDILHSKIIIGWLSGHKRQDLINEFGLNPREYDRRAAFIYEELEKSRESES